MTPTNKLIECLARACEDDDVGNLWPVLDEALGLDPDTATFEDTATALRALLPTRDPRVDPRAGDVLRWTADDDAITATITAISFGDVYAIEVSSRGTSGCVAYSMPEWAEWPDRGIDAVQVLYVAPEVDHAQR